MMSETSIMMCGQRHTVFDPGQMMTGQHIHLNCLPRPVCHQQFGDPKPFAVPSSVFTCPKSDRQLLVLLLSFGHIYVDSKVDL